MVNKIDATDDFDEIARYPEKSEEEINRVLKNWNFERIQSPFLFSIDSTLWETTLSNDTEEE